MTSKTVIRGRYAPSPTGALHVGNARTALLAWLQIRSLGGQFILRIEDLDRPRMVERAVEDLIEDLRWLGIDWDEGPQVGGAHASYLQSERTHLYQEATARLASKNLVFDCYCSRAEIALAASAPHLGEDGPRYPGTCRYLTAEQAAARKTMGQKPALRFLVNPGVTRFVDGVHGPMSLDVSQAVGDFVVRRADGIHAYQLAVAVDDALMGVTHVLRGDDLISSTFRQIKLLCALDFSVPQYFHVPLLLGADGQRLAKRNKEINVAWLRARGVRPQKLVAQLARSCGLTSEDELSPGELVHDFDLSRLTRQATIFDCSKLF